MESGQGYGVRERVKMCYMERIQGYGVRERVKMCHMKMHNHPLPLDSL